MAEDNTLLIPTYEQIATILMKLASNYSSIASVFQKVFYDTEPADVDIQIYNEAGELVTYTIPNRAKDLQNLLSGSGTPEGSIAGVKGTLYQDMTNGDLYIKETPDGKDGWNQITTNTYLKNIFIQGNGDPNGSVVAEKGILYIDVDRASLYIKTTVSGNTGWQQISATVSAFANTDLSNLSEDGNNKFADTSLSNITETARLLIQSTATSASANKSLSNLSGDGQAKFDAKENVRNKVTTISASSTNTQYPSAKCVYDLIGDVERLINAL